jgi:hypothetical protein
MGLLPPIPADPTLLRQPDGTRFWEIPVSFELIHACAGDGELLAAWLVIAAAEREDAGLGLPPREPHVLAATAGQTLDEFEANMSYLLDNGFLTRWPDGSIRVPWGRLYQHSVETANSLLASVAARRTAVASSTVLTVLQQSLDL